MEYEYTISPGACTMTTIASALMFATVWALFETQKEAFELF